MATHENVSSDLIWEITRANNSFLVKRRSGGGVQFSRDPLNLLNKNSRKHAGFVNEKAFGINMGDEDSIEVSRKGKRSNRPASHKDAARHKPQKSSRSIYKSIVGSTAKQGYRPDLRDVAVARASALRRSSKPVKTAPEKKERKRGKNKSTISPNAKR